MKAMAKSKKEKEMLKAFQEVWDKWFSLPNNPKDPGTKRLMKELYKNFKEMKKAKGVK